MNKTNINSRCWGMMLFLLIWLPINGLAQTKTFEMVVEKIDGTELTFNITDYYPTLQYQYGGEDGINTIEIRDTNGYTNLPCPEIKRIYTREITSGIYDMMSVDDKLYDVYDLNGRKIKAKVTSTEGLPNGVYIINHKKKVIK